MINTNLFCGVFKCSISPELAKEIAESQVSKAIQQIYARSGFTTVSVKLCREWLSRYNIPRNEHFKILKELEASGIVRLHGNNSVEFLAPAAPHSSKNDVEVEQK